MASGQQPVALKGKKRKAAGNCTAALSEQRVASGQQPVALKGKKRKAAENCTAALSAKRRKAVQKRWNKRKADKMCAEDASRLVGDVAGKIERGNRRGYAR